MRYVYRKACINIMLFVTIVEFFGIVEQRYQLEGDLLYYMACQETQNGKILGTHVVSSVVGTVQRKYLRKIARQLGEEDIQSFTGSSAGAIGHLQIIPSTFWVYAQDGDGDGKKDPRNPYDSIATAGYVIARLIQTHDGNVEKALASYSGGAGRYSDRVLACVRGRASCPHTPRLAKTTQ